MRSDSDFVPDSGRLRASAAVIVVALLLVATHAVAHGPHPRLTRLRRERQARLDPSIDEIVFVGSEAFTEKTLGRYMETAESGLFTTRRYSSRTLRKDLLNLERFYTTQGFLDASVRLGEIRVAPDSSSVDLVIDVRQGPRWRVAGIAFEGNAAIDTDELSQIVEVREGSPVYTNVIEADRRRVLAAYAARSYLDAKVRQDVTLDATGATASILYSIAEGGPARVGAIEIQGNEKTRDYVIRRGIEFEEGELFDFEKVGATQASLYRTGLFHSVWIEPDPADTALPVKRVLVQVNERPSGSFEMGVGYAAIDGFEIGGSLSNRNVQGQAIRLGLEARFSEFNRAARLSVGDPWFLGLPVRVEASAGYELDDEESYVGETTGGSFVLTKSFGPRLALSGGYEYERTILLEAAEGDDDGKTYTSDLLFAGTLDTRDDILNARRGALARVLVDFASSRLGGTNDFVRTELALRAFRRLHRRTVGALAVRVGWIKPHGGSGVPVNERYFAGGEGSVRGFDRNSLSPVGPDGEPSGGRALVELRAEARFSVAGPFGLVLFLDAGQAFRDIRSSRIDALEAGAGAGLRYETRLGVVRVDAATPLTADGPTRFYVSVGQAF